MLHDLWRRSSNTVAPGCDCKAEPLQVERSWSLPKILNPQSFCFSRRAWKDAEATCHCREQLEAWES